MNDQSFSFPPNTDKSIQDYINQGPQISKRKINLENTIENKVFNVSEIVMEEKSNINEISKLSEKKTKHFGLKTKTIETDWSAIEASKKEAESFQKKLGSDNEKNPGKIGKYVHAGGIPCDRNLFEDYYFTNGQVLYGGEREAIYIYTSDNYLLINGTLSNDETSLNDWSKKYFNDPDLVMNKEKLSFLEKAQKHVPELAKMAASGINKLPPYKGNIYRGDAMNREQLAEWREGKTMATSKFFSCSTSVSMGEKYARDSAKSYMSDTNVEYKPVLYVFKSESSKDISKFSHSSGENERIYTPGQAFRSFYVDEESVPGLAIIYLQELK